MYLGIQWCLLIFFVHRWISGATISCFFQCPCWNCQGTIWGFTITIGSKTDHGTDSVLCVYKNSEHIHSWRGHLGTKTFVFQVKRFVCKIAILWALSSSENIFLTSSDTLSGRMTLNTFNNKKFLIYEILFILQNSSKSLFFKWLQVKSWICGYEMADQLAKWAVNDNKFSLIFLPHSTCSVESV